MRRLALALVAVALAACGGSDGLNPPAACQVTFGGAVTATYSCVTLAVHDNRNGKTGFSISAQGTGNPIASLDFELDVGSGDLQAVTYTPTFAGSAKTGVSSTSQAWLQAAHAPPGGDQGSYTLQLTHVSPPIPTANGQVWNVHGTLDATLPPVAGTGATATMTVHASF